jgi:hypothetical protein
VSQQESRHSRERGNPGKNKAVNHSFFQGPDPPGFRLRRNDGSFSDYDTVSQMERGVLDSGCNDLVLPGKKFPSQRIRHPNGIEKGLLSDKEGHVVHVPSGLTSFFHYLPQFAFHLIDNPDVLQGNRKTHACVESLDPEDFIGRPIFQY